MTNMPVGIPKHYASLSQSEIVLRELRKAKGKGRYLDDFRRMLGAIGKHQSASRALSELRKRGIIVALEESRIGQYGRAQHLYVLPMFVNDRDIWAGRQTGTKKVEPAEPTVCRSCGALGSPAS